MIQIGNEKKPEEKNDVKKEKKTQENDTSEIEQSAPEKQVEDYAQLKDQMLRLAAEFDNYKKRVRKDVEISEKLGKAALIKSLLPIVDEFELALFAINDSKENNLTKGIEMLYSNFIDILKREGLSEVEAEGILTRISMR